MKPIIIANWKLNPTTASEAKKLVESISKKVGSIPAEVVFCPPAIYYSLLPKNVKKGAQNCYFEERGAFTGEISALMLKDMKCDYVLVGHSERRKYFSETDEIVNMKLEAILSAGLKPVLCIGETKKQRDTGEVQTVLRRELEGALKGISGSKLLKLGFSVAYEPIWAIGTGRPCDPEEGQKMKLLIGKILANIYNPNTSSKIPILYGGSVNSSNAEGYIKEAGFSGLLVGGASLKDKEFVEIVKNSV